MATRDSGSGQQRQTRRTNEAEDTSPEATDGAAAAERKEKIDDDVDAILDEIDEVLESNAEDFVRSFVQKGGQ